MNTLLEDIEEIVSKNIKVNHKVELKSSSKDSEIIITVGDLKLTYYVEAMTLWISSKINLRNIDVDNKELEQFCNMYSDIKNLQIELFEYFDKQKMNESVEETSMMDLIQAAKEKGVRPRDIFSSYKFVTKILNSNNEDGKVFEAEVVHDKNEYKTIIAHTNSASQENIEKLNS